MTGKQPKPRLRWCWECSRQLRGNQYQAEVIEGHIRIMHKDCAKRRNRKEVARFKPL
jgi:hypothetical protein